VAGEIGEQTCQGRGVREGGLLEQEQLQRAPAGHVLPLVLLHVSGRDRRSSTAVSQEGRSGCRWLELRQKQRVPASLVCLFSVVQYLAAFCLCRHDECQLPDTCVYVGLYRSMCSCQLLGCREEFTCSPTADVS
jgi:hypothetical protein